MRRLIACLLLLLPSLAWGATYTTNGSRSDVQSKVNGASSGDTVTVPSGSFTWAGAVTVTGKALTISGAGIDTTTITAGSAGAFSVACTAANFVEITGFTFAPNANAGDGLIEMSGPTAGGNDEVGFRFDHCKIHLTQVSRGIATYGIFGLIDHCSFVASVGGSIQSVSLWGSLDGNDGGFTPWTRALTLGTNHAVYIEDNTFDYTSNDQSEDAIDAYGGARVVVRHNTFLSCTQGFHGTDSGDRRSAHSFEIYSNTYTNNSANQLRYLTVRGGTGVIYSNTYGGTGASWYGITLQYYRATVALDRSGWQQCTGTVWQLGSTSLSAQGSRTCSTNGGVGFNNTDKETLGTWGGSYTTGFDGTGTQGYPGRDQPGFTTGQVLSPIYIWSNGAAATGTSGGGGSDDTLTANMIQVNRDWYDGTTKPGYVAYTYPHPSQGGGGTTTTTTIPPSVPSRTSRPLPGTFADEIHNHAF